MQDNATFLVIHGGVIALFIVAVARKYSTLVNPVTFFGGYYFVASALSPLLFLYLGLLPIPAEALRKTIFLSSTYFFAFGAGYLVKLSPFRRLLQFFVSLSRPFLIRREQLTGLTISTFLLQFITFYVGLMVLSGAGTMWLTDSRKAYQLYRSGVGVIWALAQASLMVSFLAVLSRWGLGRRRVVFYTILFSGAAFFLGSKGAILAYPVVAAVYVTFRQRKIKTSTLLFGSVTLMACVVFLQLIQHTAATIRDAIRYFDYFTYSAMFVQRAGNMTWRYGEITLSNLWYYVPRALYPGKPFVYGQNELIAIMNPGFEGVVRRTGFTPGMLQWSSGYADFGVAGVFASGLITAWISKAAFEYFVAEGTFVSIAVMVQFGFIYYIELFPGAPLLVFWIWLLAEGVLVQILTLLPHASTSPHLLAPPSQPEG